MNHYGSGMPNSAQNFGSNNSIGGNEAGSAQPEIERLMNELGKACERLNGTVNSLNERLSPLCSEPAEREATGQVSAAPMTRHGSALQGLLFSVNLAETRLRDAASRLGI